MANSLAVRATAAGSALANWRQTLEELAAPGLRGGRGVGLDLGGVVHHLRLRDPRQVEPAHG